MEDEVVVRAKVVRKVKTFQGAVSEVWWECSRCQSRIADSAKFVGQFCPVCGVEFK